MRGYEMHYNHLHQWLECPYQWWFISTICDVLFRLHLDSRFPDSRKNKKSGSGSDSDSRKNPLIPLQFQLQPQTLIPILACLNSNYKDNDVTRFKIADSETKSLIPFLIPVPFGLSIKNWMIPESMESESSIHPPYSTDKCSISFQIHLLWTDLIVFRALVSSSLPNARRSYLAEPDHDRSFFGSNYLDSFHCNFIP